MQMAMLMRNGWLESRKLVDYIMKAGMYCILNVHHDTGADNATTASKSWIKADANVYTSTKDKYAEKQDSDCKRIFRL